MGNKKEDGKWERVREPAAASLCVGRHQPRIVDEEVCVDQSEINFMDQLGTGAEVGKPSLDVLVGHLSLPVLENTVADVHDHVPGGPGRKQESNNNIDNKFEVIRINSFRVINVDTSEMVDLNYLKF